MELRRCQVQNCICTYPDEECINCPIYLTAQCVLEEEKEWDDEDDQYN